MVTTLVAVLAAGVLLGQEPATDAQDPQPTFRAGVNAVSVDAIVTTRDGTLVDDLTADDFEVFEDGTREAIESFDLVRVTGTAQAGAEDPRAITTLHAERTEAARDDVRVFVIFFDEYHVSLGASLRIKEDITTFIRRDLGPKDLLALMTPRDAATSLSFTREHDSVIRVVQGWQGRKNVYEPPQNEAEARIVDFPTEAKERIRNQVSLSALQGLAERLGNLREGRKSVLLISEGFPDYPHGDHIQQFVGDQDLRQELLLVSGAANRNNVTFYTLDPRGLAAFESQSSRGGANIPLLQSTQETLRLLARETEGRAIIDRNNLRPGLAQMVQDASAYYLLGYTSSAAPSDGRFHSIRVRVNRPGVEVRARGGYWAMRAEEATAVLSAPREGPPAEVTAAVAQIDRSARAGAIRSWVGFVPDGTGRARVLFVWEPATSGGRASDVASVTVMAASERDGPLHRGRAETDASANGNASARGGMTTFVAPAGPVQMRVQAEDAAGSALESDMLDVDVPDFAADAVGTPAFFRARTQRDVQTITANPGARPTAVRTFARTERIVVRFASTSGAPTARLLTRDGQPMSALDVQSVAEGGPFTHQAELPVASLSAGDYVVEVAAGEAADASRQFAGVRIGS
jgi:VWFA-related protein